MGNGPKFVTQPNLGCQHRHRTDRADNRDGGPKVNAAVVCVFDLPPEFRTSLKLVQSV
ncbi:MAG: hypothetical protein Kow0020_16210 [Wenzhouxiangellaceae bacterium]